MVTWALPQTGMSEPLFLAGANGPQGPGLALQAIYPLNPLRFRHSVA